MYIYTGCSQLSSLVSIAVSTPLLHLPPPEVLLSQLYVRKADGRLLLGGLDLSGPPSSGGLQGEGGGAVSVVDIPRVFHTVLGALLGVSRTVYLAPNAHTHTILTTRINNNSTNNGTNGMNNNDNISTGGNDVYGDGIIQKTCYIQAGHQLYLSFLDLPPLGQCEIRLIDSSNNSSSTKDNNKNINTTHAISSNNIMTIEVQYNTVNLSGDRDRSIATLTTHTASSPTTTTTDNNNTIGASDCICIDTHKEGRILIDITTISPTYTTTSKLSRRNEVASYSYELLIVITPSLTPLYRPLPLVVADTENGHNYDPFPIILSTKVLELLSYIKQAHHTHNYSLLMSAQALLPPSSIDSSSSGSSGNTSINQQVEIARLWRELIEG